MKPFARFLMTVAALVTLAVASRAAEERPNVIFILADDLGWRDTSVYGSEFYETPNIDRLAARGMRFTQAYAANPLCSPTRASILTGLWPARIGITSPSCHLPQEIFESTLSDRAGPTVKVLVAQSATRLKHDYDTLAEALGDAGYATGHFGKWHLGSEPYDALRQGFDVDVPHWHGPGPAGGYIAPWKFPESLHFQGAPGESVEDRMAAEAAKFIEANRERPFYLNYWAFSVHSPWGAKPEVIAKYAAKADPQARQKNALYAAMIENLDDSVGTLLDTLDRLDLAKRTIIVFFSDNGGIHFNDSFGNQVTDNHPLRGGKANTYEGGTREPCVVVWPGVAEAGSTSHEVIQSIDWRPTILAMTGVPPRPGQNFDGISIEAALRGGELSREAIYCHFPHTTPAAAGLPSTYVRKGDWKLIRFYGDAEDGGDRFELYNLADDVGETKNLADGMSDKVAELNAMIDAFLVETGAIVPRRNPSYDPSAVKNGARKKKVGDKSNRQDRAKRKAAKRSGV